MHGKNGQNTILRVPCGVVVRRILNNDEYFDEETKTVRKVYHPNNNNNDGEDENLNEELTREQEWDAKLSYSSSDRSAGGYLASNDYDSDEETDDDEESYDDDESFYDTHIVEAPDLTNFTPWGERERVQIADLDKPGAHVIVATGGRGGYGSSIFASRQGALPPPDVLAKYSKPRPGETAMLELELKLIADLGLVGFPNAGKSSLLSATSRATPHIAPYPFTTLNPLVGYIEYRDGFRVCAADVPGLIAGASEGRGKGHDFLRHLERTKALLYIVDAAAMDGRDPISDFEILLNEIEAYGDGDMLNRRCLVAANKVDLLLKDECEEIVGQLQKKANEAGIRLQRDVLKISAGVTGEGLAALTKAIRETVVASEEDRLKEEQYP
jgi:Obg family GTPase CgtA